MSWCRSFVERHSFPIVSSESPEIFRNCDFPQNLRKKVHYTQFTPKVTVLQYSVLYSDYFWVYHFYKVIVCVPQRHSNSNSLLKPVLSNIRYVWGIIFASLENIFFLKNYLAILTISFIFSIKHAWKKEKNFLGTFFLAARTVQQ